MDKKFLGSFHFSYLKTFLEKEVNILPNGRYMGRNNNSSMNGVINAKYDNASPRKRSEMDSQERNKPGNNVKDPVRCPLCSAVLMCPRNKDYEEFLDGKLMRCMTSSDPGCKAATSRKSNQEYLAQVQLRVKKLHDHHSR